MTARLRQRNFIKNIKWNIMDNALCDYAAASCRHKGTCRIAGKNKSDGRRKRPSDRGGSRRRGAIGLAVVPTAACKIG